MTRPTFITSFVDAANQQVTVNGKVVRFDFSRRFGPLLIDEEGRELDKQPISERDAFWPPFNRWLADWTRKNPEPPPRPGKTDHLDKPRKAP